MEQVVEFGANKELVGVITFADTQHKPQQRAVLLLNSGLLHRVGPFRMNAELARYLAAQGYTVMRFDLTGIGDSGSNRSALTYDEKIVQDLRDAATVLCDQAGVNEIVSMGNCTGAVNAHKHLVNDERVKAAILLDGYYYPTMKYYVQRYAPILFDWTRMKNIIVRLFNRFRSEDSDSGKHKSTQSKSQGDMTFGMQSPSKEQAEKELNEALSQGKHLHLIYSGGLVLHYTYQDQMFDAIPSLKVFRNQIQITLLKEADHTYFIPADRARLYDHVSNWLGQLSGA